MGTGGSKYSIYLHIADEDPNPAKFKMALFGAPDSIGEHSFQASLPLFF